MLLLAATALASPTVALASTGGAATTPSAGTGAGSPSAPAPTPTPANSSVSASGDGITFTTLSSEVLRQPTRFTGTVAGAPSGAVVEIERRGRQTGWTWAPTTHATVGPDGSFSAVWPTNHIGQFAIRAVLESSRRAGAAAASPSLTITVYRPSVATLYGPGFYGHRTACGQRLTRSTIGVANRTLPCGTRVSILYAGQVLVVPVIDRGPYANGADWDLTEATGRALGLTGTATIAAVSLRH